MACAATSQNVIKRTSPGLSAKWQAPTVPAFVKIPGRPESRRSAVSPGVTLQFINLTIELDTEVDGRWIAELPELNLILYGHARREAIQRAQVAAPEILLDRIAHSELPPDSANATFDIGA